MTHAAHLSFPIVEEWFNKLEQKGALNPLSDCFVNTHQEKKFSPRKLFVRHTTQSFLGLISERKPVQQQFLLSSNELDGGNARRFLSVTIIVLTRNDFVVTVEEVD